MFKKVVILSIISLALQFCLNTLSNETHFMFLSNNFLKIFLEVESVIATKKSNTIMKNKNFKKGKAQYSLESNE